MASERIKIGEVARRFAVSPDLLRLYEREGLLIPIKSQHGTRYFTEQDCEWIATLLRLVRDAGMNFEAIRRLLAMTPCWQVRQCGYRDRHQCPYSTERTRPCWMLRACCNGADCYSCPVYRGAPQAEPLQALLA